MRRCYSDALCSCWLCWASTCVGAANSIHGTATRMGYVRKQLYGLFIRKRSKFHHFIQLWFALYYLHRVLGKYSSIGQLEQDVTKQEKQAEMIDRMHSVLVQANTTIESFNDNDLMPLSGYYERVMDIDPDDYPPGHICTKVEWYGRVFRSSVYITINNLLFSQGIEISINNNNRSGTPTDKSGAINTRTTRTTTTTKSTTAEKCVGARSVRYR